MRSRFVSHQDTHLEPVRSTLVKPELKFSNSPTLSHPSRIAALEAASSLFSEQGYDAASMQDIADLAGLHKSTLYHHFRSKDEILLAICDHTLRELLESIGKTRAMSGLSPHQRVVEAFDRAAEIGLTTVRETNIILSQRPTSPAGHEILEKRRIYERQFADLVKEAQDAGQIAATSDATLLARLLLGMINWVLIWYKPDRSNYAMTQIRTGLHEILMGDWNLEANRSSMR